MPQHQLILGTAGHIDHGKTALVRALTGIDTDRLEAEKQRGISIELGFAHLSVGDCRIGIVDVPGHERFIRNMLAGACGIDVAMLVVAADDSVMPQTREHLAILKLLRVRHGLIALTKIDLVEPSWLDLVEHEVRELVADSFLAHAPIVRASAVDGRGIDELKMRIAEACRAVEPRTRHTGDEPFRLAVDRSFALKGLGTIITGSVWSGSVAVGDELEWLPAAKRIRVRGLQSHSQEVQRIGRGQRAALDVIGAHHTEIGRGHVVATPGLLAASRRLTVRLDLLDASPRPLKNRARVRLHLGTQEVMAGVRLLAEGVLAPGGWCYAQLEAAEPVAAVSRQPFVIRSESPLQTIGGGRVLQPVADRISRNDSETIGRLQELACGDDLARAAAAAYFRGAAPSTGLVLCRDADVSIQRAETVLKQLEKEGITISLRAGTRHQRRVHRDFYSQLRAKVLTTLSRLHDRSPLQTLIRIQTLYSRLRFLDRELLEGIVERLLGESVLVGDGNGIARADFSPALTQAQQRLRDRVIEAFREAGLRPPQATDLSRELGVGEEEVRPIIALCAGQGQLVHIGSAMYLHREWEAKLRASMAEQLRKGPGMTVSEIKDLLGTTRKFAVPMCEYLDRIGLTRRVNDVRVLANPLDPGER